MAWSQVDSRHRKIDLSFQPPLNTSRLALVYACSRRGEDCRLQVAFEPAYILLVARDERCHPEEQQLAGHKAIAMSARDAHLSG